MDCNRRVPVVSSDIFNVVAEFVKMVIINCNEQLMQWIASKVARAQVALFTARSQDNIHHAYEPYHLAPEDTSYVAMTHIHDGETYEASLDLTVHDGRVPANQRAAPFGEPAEEDIAIPDYPPPHGAGPNITYQTDLSADFDTPK